MYVLLIYSIIHVNKHVALRPQKRDGLLGTGNVGVWEKEWLARPRAPTRKDRGGGGPPPEQLCWGSGDLAIAQQLAYYATAVSTGVRSSHKDNVRSTAAEEQVKQKKSNFLSPAPPPCSWSLLDPQMKV